MPFTYRDTTDQRYAGTIGDLMLRRGDIAANQAREIANAQARAVEVGGNAAAGAAQAIGAQVAAIPREIQRQKQETQQSQIGALDLQAKQRGADATKFLSKVMVDTPKVTEDGVSVWDTPTITRAMADGGFGPEAGAAAQHLDGINNAFRAARAAQVALVKHGAESVAAAGNDPDLARQFLDQMETNKLMPAEDVAKYREFIKADPANTEKLTAYLMGPQKGVVVGEGGTLVNPATNKPMFTAPPKPPNETELAIKAAQGDPAAIKAMALLKPGPKRTETEQALDAYAVSIGKKDASQLTDADRQAYDKRKATVGSDQAFTQHQRERQYDIKNPIPEKAANQDKLEQQYRTVLARAMSSRSGGIGLEDQKVGQANHLLALLEQTYDPKTDSYNLPKTLQGELAAGLARLVAPGGNVGIEMMREFDQKTLKGDIAGALTYITGHPFPTATQDFAKLLKDSIERQGAVAEQNREGSMGYLRGLVPTELEETRRLALEANNLNSLRQSRVIQNTQTGERKLQTSVDGGKTWK